MQMKLIELESNLTLFIYAHFQFVYVMQSAALNPPVKVKIFYFLLTLA